MNLRTKLLSAALVAVVCQSAAAQSAEPMRLKGWVAGETSADVCAPDSVVRQQDLLSQTGVSDFEFPAITCNVTVHDVAGLIPSEQASLLFWKGKLVRAVIRVNGLEFEHVAQLRTAMIDLFGTAEASRTNSHRLDRWRRAGSETSIEWTRANKLDNAVVALTHLAGWAEYQAARVKANAAVEGAARARRARSVSD